MFVRCSLLLLLVASRASAQVVPGTGDDPILALGIYPEVVDAPLLEGIAIRGADPDDTKVLFEGFEVPHLFHAPLRSALAGKVVAADNDVDRGRATSFLKFEPVRSTSAEITTADIQAAYDARRTRTFAQVRFNPIETEHLPRYVDAFVQSGGLSLLITDERSARVIAVKRVAHAGWYTTLAVSPMFDGDDMSLDARAETEHEAAAAGLRRVKWRIGAESLNTRHDIGTIIWTPDQAAWSSVTAFLAPNIVARAGVRVDAFLRARDVATQPRGTIEARVSPHNIVKLEAAAYRRPPQRAEELTADHLHPERTTEVVASFNHEQGALAANVAGYYIDRTHLIVADQLGVLANTGFGTSQGVEIEAALKQGRWFLYGAASLSSSTRHDFFRGREHPSSFDQPVRVDALVQYKANRWKVAARYSLSSGLPFTPVVESTYHSDSDTYVPVYGFTNSEQLPWMHRLDIRGDVRFNKHFSGFLDLLNAYAANTPIGYAYSFDFKTRLTTTLPIFPFVGIRGEL